MNVAKRYLPARAHRGDTGIRVLQEIDHAAWVWHPAVDRETEVFLAFRAELEVGQDAEPLKLHISADQRYELYCDGERISKGPDRGHIDRYCYSSYTCELSPGPHLLEAHVWWLGESAPEAMVTHRGGFVFKAEGEYDELLTTGKSSALWQVSTREGWSLTPTPLTDSYHVVGKEQLIDGAVWLAEPESWATPTIVRHPVRTNQTGVSVNGWHLFPSTLPDQIDRDLTPGCIRAITEGPSDESHVYSDADCKHPEISTWNVFLENQDQAIEVAPNRELTLIWDLDDYYCAFAEIEADGGEGALVEWEWAESLFVDGQMKVKENRDQVAGKWWRGFGHSVTTNGQLDQHYRFHWWNSGRYCRLRIKTADSQLVLKRLVLNETGYPLVNDGTFECSDPAMTPIRKISTRVMQMCSHETYMDCPYYEQMMYVGDTRLEVLTHYVMQKDPRLPRRAIELFDQSRREWGFTTERVSSRALQLSPTFSCIWVWMVHDYLYWRGDLDWVADRMIGVHSSLEYFKPSLNAEGLLQDLPGWTFTDWVPEWTTGYPPGALDGVSSLVNLQYLLSLQKAADIDRQLGDVPMAASLRDRADRMKAAIVSKFWNEERGLLQDDTTGAAYSEHAQCLGLLAGVFTAAQEQRVLDGLLNAPDLSRATVYFSFYLLEVLAKYGYVEKLLDKYTFWRELADQGFKTTVESPEPSRSDCHAWGAHPMYHMTASLFGLRPTSPGMASVTIKPLPSTLSFMKGSAPSPRGEIRYDLQFDGDTCTGEITLPECMEGAFIWNGTEQVFTGQLSLT